jgi:hypothetical protein
MTWKCPKCQSKNLSVEVKIMARLYQSQHNFETVDVGSDHEWDETSLMLCHNCRFAGEVHEFEENGDAEDD